MRGTLLVTAALLVAPGCMHDASLRPASDAQPQQGVKDAARAESSGVVLVASGNAWKGEPDHLEHSLVPVLVRVENHSGRPLRLEYGFFTLVSSGESRFQYAAVPPLMLSPHLSDGPSMGGSGPGRGESLDMRGGAYRQVDPHSPFVGSTGPYYPNTAGRQCVDPLPSPDMIEKALPEGTLVDGGRIEGFLYFQGVTERESQVVLNARLVDGSSGETFGSLDIPFQVKKD